MKKFVAPLLMSIAPSTFAVDATPLFSFYLGGGAWQGEFSGNVGTSVTDLAELGIAEDENNVYFYAVLEHAVPVIPNFRLESTNIEISGTGSLSTQLLIDGKTIDANAQVGTDLDLSYTDLTLYYEIAFLDIGLTARQIDASIDVVELTGSDTISEEASVTLPLLYAQGRFSFPGTGLFALGSINTISYDGNSMTDYRAALGWETELSFLARFGAELGYRSFTVELSDDEEWEADIETSGPYLGLDIKF